MIFSKVWQIKKNSMYFGEGKIKYYFYFARKEKKTEDRILVIVDGAAFGAEAKDVVTYLKTYGGALYAPESFEWMILTAGVIPGKSQKEILAEPENYIESAKFVSWERFFTDLLITETQNDPVWAIFQKEN